MAYSVALVGIRNNRQEMFKLLDDQSNSVTVNREKLIELINLGAVENAKLQKDKIIVDKSIKRVLLTNRKQNKINNKKQKSLQSDKDARQLEIRQEIINKYTGKNDILYHGQREGLVGSIKANSQRNICDFGYGFYLGDKLESSESRIQTCPHGEMYVMQLDKTGLKVYEFNDDILWAVYVGYNRNKIDLQRYPNILKMMHSIENNDIIVGYIADDKISQAFSEFLDGTITDKALTECLKLVKYGNQTVLKTERACKKVKILGQYKMTKEVREYRQKWQHKIKESMDSDIAKIKQNYEESGRRINRILMDLERQL